MARIQLSTNFFLDEFTRSQAARRHGIKQVVSLDGPVFRALQALCVDILQDVRDALGTVHVTSGYRSREVNRLVKGSRTSQHCFGEAADIVVGGYSPLEVCSFIAESGLPFHQLIHEHGEWAHVSIAPPGRAPAREVLTCYYDEREDKTVYVAGLHAVEALEA